MQNQIKGGRCSIAFYCYRMLIIIAYAQFL
nr:MAG TPA_asm: hypothetical protein [Caudoviricetes sp.]